MPTEIAHPASAIQHQFWLAQTLDPESTAYSIPSGFVFRGPCDPARLRACVERLVAEYLPLRSTFQIRNGVLTQVEGPAEIEFSEHRIDADDDKEFIEAARRSMETEAARPFNLETGPVVRLAWFTNGYGGLSAALLNVHHTAIDLRTKEIFGRRLGQLWSDPSGETTAEDRYEAFCAWQKAWLASEEAQRQAEFWRDRLKDCTQILPLPNDLPSTEPAHAAEAVAFALGDDLADRVRSFARERALDPYVVLLAAYAAVLARFSGTDSFAVGVPLSNRRRRDFHDVAGCFVNTVPLPVRFRSSENFSAFARQMRTAMLEAHRNQELPTESIITAVHPMREEGRPPLFQVGFTVETLMPLSLEGVEVEPIVCRTGGAQLELFMRFSSLKEGMIGQLEYDTKRFSPAMAQRYVNSFLTLLVSAIEEPSAEIGELNLLPEEDDRQLRSWNATDRAYDLLPLYTAFQRQAARTPQAEALRFAGGSLTYREMGNRVMALVQELREQGAGHGKRVAVCLARSPGMVVAVHAIVASGAAYVPIDPELPPIRLRYLLDDSAASCVICDRANRDLVEHLGMPVVSIDECENAPTGDMPPIDGPSLSDSAYMIYTSGSTGTPKAVLNSHKGIANRLCWMQERFPLKPPDVVLLKTPFSFDVSVWELFWPLQVGATLAIAPEGCHRDPARLAQVMADFRVSTMHSVPSMLDSFLSFPKQTTLPDLQRIICSGEALPKTLADRFFKSLPNVELHNLYGPTEAAVDVTHWPCNAEDTRSFVPIGHAIANTQMYVLDAKLQRVPIGVPGEICIGGIQVAQGYWGRQMLTRNRFVPDPFSQSDARLYRTGDIGVFLQDGSLRFLGRDDHQIKIRGHRIELAEIESHLRRVSGVQDAVVLAPDLIDRQPTLVAYITGTASIQALREHCSRHLPGVMVPSFFITLDAMPLMPNGKVDRNVLPVVDPATLEQSSRSRVTGSNLEHELAVIWSRILGISVVDPHARFTEQGGNSLLLTKLYAELLPRWPGLHLVDLFEHGTVNSLAAHLESRTDYRETESAARIEQESHTTAHADVSADPMRRSWNTPRPLSVMQQHLWFVEEMDLGKTVAHMAMAYRLKGHLHLETFRRALSAVAERHEVLRTTIEMGLGEPRQAVAQTGHLSLLVTDLRAIAPDVREARMEQAYHEAVARPFDLTREPLARARMFLLDEDEQVLFFMAHRLIWDEASFDIFIGELGALYEAFADGRPSPLKPLEIQYGDFANWHNQLLLTKRLEASRSYWRATLAGELPPLEMPTDRSRPAQLSFRGGAVPIRIEQEQLQALRDIAQYFDTTVELVLLASMHVILHRYTGQEKLLIGMGCDGRQRPSTGALLGAFANTLVLRTQVTADESFADLLAVVRRVQVEAMAHADMPFDQLVNDLGISHDMSRTPVYQAAFTFRESTTCSLGPFPFTAVPVAPDASPTELAMSLQERSDTIVGQLTYTSDLYDHATMERFVSNWQTLLTSIIADPSAEVGAMNMIPETERKLLEEWNNTVVDFPAHALAHEPFEQRARIRPDAEALRMGKSALTYRELDGRANQLARRLQEEGVGRDDLVGLHLERGPEMVVALFGILKAGGAYVPLDPSFPPERVAYMLENSRAKTIVTTQALEDCLPPHQATVVDIEDIPTEWCAAPPCPADPTCRAYVIYTSGSTGKPKGVELQHRNVTNFLASMGRDPGLDSSDVMLAVTTLSFDIAVLELYLPLWVGARIILADAAQVADGVALNRLIHEHGVTLMQATPSTWRLLLGAGFEGGDRFKALIGGEAVPKDLAQELAARCSSVHNMYGPTETTVWSTCYRFPSKIDRVLVGRPIANTTTLILDERRQPVPLGVPGELYIGGEGVARGYLGRPELTEERFVTDPATGNRIYRTGDLVRQLADGNLECLRRLDTQVKVHGHRIELGEIETAMGQVASVARGVAHVVEIQPGDNRLVAYVQVCPGEVFLEQEIADHLRSILPAYMVPQHFMELEAFPLTPNGKIDRKALPAVSVLMAKSTRTCTPPSNTLESRLLGIWSRLLSVGEVGIHDGFLEMGGSSFLLTRFYAELHPQWPQLRLLALFQHGTIAKLASYLETLGRPDEQAPDDQARNAITKRAARAKSARRERRRI